MRTTDIFLAIGLCVPCVAQTGVIAQGNVARGTFSFYWQSRVEPPSPPLADSLGYGAGYHTTSDSVYRVMIDRTRNVYFGYEVQVTALQKHRYRLKFEPLNLTAENFTQLHMEPADRWAKLDIPVPSSRFLYPFRDEPDVVNELDVVAVDLMMNPSSKQKIVDYVVLQGPGRAWSFDQPHAVREFSYPEGDPRELSLSDVGMRVLDPQVSVNGVVQYSEPGEVAGAYIWFSPPERERRYIFTLLPHAGFQKAGEVRGSTLRFTLAGDTVVITSARPIVSADAVLNLYERIEPASRVPGRLTGAAIWEPRK